MDLPSILKASPFEERETALSGFKDHFQDLVDTLLGRDGRLLVFVDDLDRCSPERLIKLLDALHLFLGCERCIYFLALDRDITEQAIRLKYKDYRDADRESREYLEKIVDLPFELPPLVPDGMRHLLDGLGNPFPDELCREIFALGLEPNPRKVKRNINIYFLLCELARLRSSPELNLTPVRLAKVSVIRSSHRELFRHLVEHPEDLGLLEAACRGSEPFGVLEGFLNRPRLKELLLTGDPTKRDDVGFVTIDGGQPLPLKANEIEPYLTLTRFASGLDRGEDARFRRDPDIIIIHPYPLQPNFTGRIAERKRLTEWFIAGRRPVCVVEAIGGMGKSALAWF